jgi:hypothetical protein
MIRVSVRGSDEIIRLLKGMPQRVTAALVKGMEDSTILIQSLAKVNAPVYRGLLRISIAQAVRQEGQRVIGEVGSAVPYADVLEKGRNVGWFPPISELKTWARRKLGDERLAFVIARAIKRRGFKEQPYLLPAIEAAGPRITLIFANRLAEILQQGGA